MKYIIEVNSIGNGLFKAKGFNTLVFDRTGLNKLEKVENEIRVGDEVLQFGRRFIVTRVKDSFAYGFTSTGDHAKCHTSILYKTGRHFDLSEMIDEKSDE